VTLTQASDPRRGPAATVTTSVSSTFTWAPSLVWLAKVPKTPSLPSSVFDTAQTMNDPGCALTPIIPVTR
jgi:hypothetical protein